MINFEIGVNVEGEQVYPLAGMRYPAGFEAASGSRSGARGYSALELFEQAARRADPGFVLDGDSLGGAIRICELVEGLPLGLLLAASWAGLYTPRADRGRDRAGLGFLAVEWQDMPELQRSLRATFEYSWNLLFTSERELLAGLSVFRGSFTAQTAEQVLGSGAGKLRRLVEKSLLGRSQPRPEAEERYLMHDLLRQFAGEKLAALVFVHCWTCNRGEWNTQVEYFAAKHQVVSLDLAGHGSFGRERKDYTIEAFAGDVTAVINKLGLKRVVLIGSSMGGPVTVEAAKSLGDRVIGVVAVDSFYTGFEVPKDPKKAEAMGRGFLKPFEENYPVASANFMRGFFGPGADPVLVEGIASATGAADTTMALSAMRNVFTWHQRNVPTTLGALGANINLTPAQVADSIRQTGFMMTQQAVST